jgi:hypothetical protein
VGTGYNLDELAMLNSKMSRYYNKWEPHKVRSNG